MIMMTMLEDEIKYSPNLIGDDEGDDADQNEVSM